MYKLLIISIISIFIQNCSLNKVVHHHGVHNLDKKQSKLKINYSNKNDMVFFISVSGESKNLLNGIDFANLRNQKTASLTGSKENNQLRTKSNLSLWVDSKAYNHIENIHQILLLSLVDLIIGKTEYPPN